MSYPISVVVPTKNRYKYLKKLIELVISFHTDELELVVQDNSDNNDEIVEWMKDKQYEWLKYFYCPDKLTSIQNFDKGISNTTGDYVCFIGDDDGVVRNIVDCAKWMKYNNIEALRCAKTTYQWMESGHGGTIFSEKQNSLVEYINPIKELKRVLENGCQGIDNIPVTYVGVVKREILTNIYNDYGTYFPGGASADIANGVALCFYVKRYVKVNIPIIITGASKMTGGVADRQKPLKLSELSFTSNNVELEWEGNLPKFWLGTLVWPESAIKSLRALKKESFISYINFDKIIASSIVRVGYDPSDYIKYGSSNFAIRVEMLIIRAQKLFNGVRNRVIRLISSGKYAYKSYCFKGVTDIVEAEEKLSVISRINFKEIEY